MDFWDVHGIGFILAMCFFPRLTLLFATAHGGCLWWLGWVFAPRLTVAIIATGLYWEHNKFLIILTWIWALGGEGGEKNGASRVAGRSSE